MIVPNIIYRLTLEKVRNGAKTKCNTSGTENSTVKICNNIWHSEY